MRTQNKNKFIIEQFKLYLQFYQPKQLKEYKVILKIFDNTWSYYKNNYKVPTFLKKDCFTFLLGQHWNRIKKKQKVDFTKTFIKQSIIDFFRSYFGTYRSNNRRYIRFINTIDIDDLGLI